jgi:hypothetical protein
MQRIDYDDGKDDDIRILVLDKADEKFVFIYEDGDKKKRVELLRVFGRFAANPDLTFSWYDAAHMALKVKE